MKLTILAVKDRALDAYGRPIFAHTAGQGIRSFHDEINRPSQDNEMYKHPEDYDLYLIGYFEDLTGELISINTPERIAVGTQHSTKGK